MICLFLLGLQALAAEPVAELPFPRSASPWGVGIECTLGARQMPYREMAGDWTTRLDWFALELRGPFPMALPVPHQPQRLDVQVDWLQTYFLAAGTTRPRLPVTAYATWLRPSWRRRDMAVSTGVYLELGLDRFVVEEQLRKRPGGTAAAAVRLGWERPRLWWDVTTVGFYIRAATGFSMGSDPNQLALTWYHRLGLERSWVWGRRVQVRP